MITRKLELCTYLILFHIDKSMTINLYTNNTYLFVPQKYDLERQTSEKANTIYVYILFSVQI